MKDGSDIDAIDPRFLVHGRMEILDVLNDLVYRCEPVTAVFGDARFATRLLEAREGAVVFESSGNPDADRRLLDSGGCSLIAFPDGIRVQFLGLDVQETVWGEKAAFRILLPNRLARMQRQETFRIVMSPDATIAVALFSDSGAALGDWPLRDLSVGGLGIALESETQLAAIRGVARVRLALPGHGDIECNVELRHATELGASEQGAPYRLGVSFSGLPVAARAAIQRYIVDVEHARRSRQADDGPQ